MTSETDMTDPKNQKHAGREREDLTGEHKTGDLGQVVFTILFLGIWISDSFFFHYSTFLNQYVPLFIRIPLAVILLALGGYLAGRGLSVVFGEVRDTPGVIRKSVFNIVRHPIYLGELLLYLGLLMISISILASLVCLAAFLFLHFISRHEEKLLLERFGKEYQQYMKEVPMWIPRFRKK
jgi:protein-S-isoprenylcysteine O-methyltransferase Ste14